jgi:hypothetical protein
MISLLIQLDECGEAKSLLVSLLCSPSDPGTVELDVVCHVNGLLQCGCRWPVACCSVRVALSSLGSRSLESDTVQIKLQG